MAAFSLSFGTKSQIDPNCQELNTPRVPLNFLSVDAFTRISRAQAEALFVLPGPAAYADRGLIVDFATRMRLPSSFAYREAVELGGLMSYGVNTG